MRFRILIPVLLLSLSSQALAVCDNERDEYNHFRDLCERLSAASGGTAILGTILTAPLFGIGGLLGLAPGAAAANACRIRDEKKANLERCESFEAAAAQAIAEHNRLQAEAERIRAENERQEVARQEERHKRINEVSYAHVQRRDQAVADFNSAVDRVIQEMIDEGFDVNSPESQEVIRASRADLEAALQIQLNQIEKDRRAAISQI